MSAVLEEGRVHDRIEEGFRRLALFVVARPVWVLAVSVGLTLFLASWLPKMQAEFNSDSYLLENDHA